MCYFLLVTRDLSLITRYFLLVTFYSLLVTFYSSLVIFYSVHVTFYLIFVTFICHNLLVTRYYLLILRVVGDDHQLFHMQYFCKKGLVPCSIKRPYIKTRTLQSYTRSNGDLTLITFDHMFLPLYRCTGFL